jgi:D-threonate/D-erythronate kinase
MNLLALADDVTGALEVGALLQAPVFLDFDTESVDRLVIDTETRHLGAQEAADKIRSSIRQRQPDLIYKKTDSTLRGNIGAELAALANAYLDRRLIFLPAYPAMGRTVVQGELLVHGVPVHLSDFASDPLNPVTSSNISALFHPDTRVSIVDAISDNEMARAIDTALQVRPLPILAGPAGVARCISRHFGLHSPTSEQIRLSPQCLIVNGSLHPVAKEQVRRIRPGAGWVVMNFKNNLEPPQSFVRKLAHAVREKLEQEPFRTLIVLGGDSAFALLQALNVRVIQPIGEVAAGVPVSRVGPWQLVTKAGGFGDVDLLARLQAGAA